MEACFYLFRPIVIVLEVQIFTIANLKLCSYYSYRCGSFEVGKCLELFGWSLLVFSPLIQRF